MTRIFIFSYLRAGPSFTFEFKSTRLFFLFRAISSRIIFFLTLIALWGAELALFISLSVLSLGAKKVEDWNCKFEISGSYNNDLGFLSRVYFGYWPRFNVWKSSQSIRNALFFIFLSYYYLSIEIYLIIIITVYIFNPGNVRFYPKLQVWKGSFDVKIVHVTLPV